MKTQKEKTKDLGKLKGKKNDRPQSSQPKKNTKE